MKPKLGYLLDLNHVSALFDKQPKVIARAQAIGDSQLRASAITCGELEGGHRMTAAFCTNPQRRAEYVKWFNEKFLANVLDVTATTRTHYAEIIDAIWTKHPKTNRNQKTERYLVEELGVDINDVWLAAIALEHNLVLVTRDGMDKISEAVKNKGLIIENWIDDPPISSPTASPPPISRSVSAS